MISRQPSAALFILRAKAFGQVLRVWLVGELSKRTAAVCSTDLQEPLSGREPIVVFDLSGLSVVDGCGLEMLNTIKCDIENQGRRLLLSAPDGRYVARLLGDEAIAGFDVLEAGGLSRSSCAVCDGSLPSDLHLCPQCGAAV